MVKIIGVPFDKYVDQQVEIRQNKLAKTSRQAEDLIVFNNNTAWIRLTSGVVIDKPKAGELSRILGISAYEIEGTALATNLILFGGVATLQNSNNVTRPGGIGYGLKNAYGYLSNTAEGLKPFPGIENITCNYKNNGSLRQATINVKCFTRAQFEAIEALYLRLGFTLILEWGNSSWFDNRGKYVQESLKTLSKIPGTFLKRTRGNNPEEYKRFIEELRVTTSGNYDAMVGRVVNYDWTLESDLSYSIVIHLITTGDIIDSLKANISRPTGPTTVQVTAGGQSFSNIILNKQASQLNAFFYELYQDKFRPLIGAVGTPETQEILNKLDNVVATSENVNEIQKKLLEAIKYYRTVILQSFTDGLAIYRRSTVNEFRIRIIQPGDTGRWNEILENLRIDGSKAFAMFEDPDEKLQGADQFDKNLQAIQTYLASLKPSEETEQVAILQELTGPVDIVLGRILNTGYVGITEVVEIPGSKYDDGVGDYIFTNILEQYFIELDGREYL